MKIIICITIILAILSCQNEITINSHNSKKYNGYSSYHQDSDLHFLTDYKEGINCAKQSKLPIFLQFTCHGCLGYDEFQNDLVHSKAIRKVLNNDFVTVILYADDRSEMAHFDKNYYQQLREESIQYIEKQRTIGSLNAFIQVDYFQSNSQPFYVIMTNNEMPLIQPFGYLKRDEIKLLNKLSQGLNIFKINPVSN